MVWAKYSSFKYLDPLGVCTVMVLWPLAVLELPWSWALEPGSVYAVFGAPKHW